jgi:hypothetical protein
LADVGPPLTVPRSPLASVLMIDPEVDGWVLKFTAALVRTISP